MKKLFIYAGCAIVVAAAAFWLMPDRPTEPDNSFYTEIIPYIWKNKGKVPKLKQRSRPYSTIPPGKQLAAVEATQAARLKHADHARAISWGEAGPTNVPGRITDIGVHPSQPNTVYAGAAAGGVFKSYDGGNSWTPIFDDAGTP